MTDFPPFLIFDIKQIQVIVSLGRDMLSTESLLVMIALAATRITSAVSALYEW